MNEFEVHQTTFRRLWAAHAGLRWSSPIGWKSGHERTQQNTTLQRNISLASGDSGTVIPITVQPSTSKTITMSQYGFQSQPQNAGYGAQNLQFYPSTYSPAPVSGHATPSQAAYGYGASPAGGSYGAAGYGSGFASGSGVSGRMGEQAGLRTGWLAAFSTEGYDGEPPLLEELGVNFSHIQSKVSAPATLSICWRCRS